MNNESKSSEEKMVLYQPHEQKYVKSSEKINNIKRKRNKVKTNYYLKKKQRISRRKNRPNK